MSDSITVSPRLFFLRCKHAPWRPSPYTVRSLTRRFVLREKFIPLLCFAGVLSFPILPCSLPLPQFFLSPEAYFSPLGYTAFGFVVPANDELFLGTSSSLPSVSHLTSGWARGAFFYLTLLPLSSAFLTLLPTRLPPSEEAGVSELRKAANFQCVGHGVAVGHKARNV